MTCGLAILVSDSNQYFKNIRSKNVSHIYSITMPSTKKGHRKEGGSRGREKGEKLAAAFIFDSCHILSHSESEGRKAEAPIRYQIKGMVKKMGLGCVIPLYGLL